MYALFPVVICIFGNLLVCSLSDGASHPPGIVETQVLNQGLSHECTSFSHVRAGALT